jgi:hypothetical protein
MMLVIGAPEKGFECALEYQSADDQFDAFLYLGPSSAMTMASVSPSLRADKGYIEMRMRRFALAPGQGGQAGQIG